MTGAYQLYAAPLSLYSGKARGYLRWKNIAFREILCSRDVYETDLVPRVGYPIIPVMVTPDDSTVQDTTDIIDYIEANEPGPSVYPSGAKQKLAALILELYGDEFLLIAAMHYRWAYNKEYAWGEFGKALFPALPPEQQFEAGKQAAVKFMGFLPMLGISEDTMPGIESSYEAFLRAFNTHLASHDFLFGSRPSIGDYGLLGPLYAHNYRDRESGKHMEKIAPRVADWCRRTHAPAHPLSGDFLGGDEIPDTLLPILEMFAREQLPILLSTLEHMKTWHSENPDAHGVPRAIGMHTFTIGGTSGQRGVIPYSLWMLQRVTDHLSSLGEPDKANAEKLLKTIGASALIDLEISPRLTRTNFKLTLA